MPEEARQSKAACMKWIKTRTTEDQARLRMPANPAGFYGATGAWPGWRIFLRR